MDAQADLTLHWLHRSFFLLVCEMAYYPCMKRSLRLSEILLSLRTVLYTRQKPILVPYETLIKVGISSAETTIHLAGAITAKVKLIFLSCKEILVVYV